MFLEGNKKTWLFLACLAAGMAISGCGDSDNDDAGPGPDPGPVLCEGIDCYPEDTTLNDNLSGVWARVGDTSNQYSEDGSDVDVEGTWQSIMVISDGEVLDIFDCGGETATSIVESENEVSFELDGLNYTLTKTSNTRMQGEATWSDETETGTATIEMVKIDPLPEDIAQPTDVSIGSLQYRLNGGATQSTQVSCFNWYEGQGTATTDEGSYNFTTSFLFVESESGSVEIEKFDSDGYDEAYIAAEFGDEQYYADGVDVGATSQFDFTDVGVLTIDFDASSDASSDAFSIEGSAQIEF